MFIMLKKKYGESEEDYRIFQINKEKIDVCIDNLILN